MNIARYISCCIGALPPSPVLYLARIHFFVDNQGNDYADFVILSDSELSAIKTARELLLDLTIQGDITSVGDVELSKIQHRRIWDAESSGNRIGRMGEIFNRR